jgi:hypothetical protein
LEVVKVDWFILGSLKLLREEAVTEKVSSSSSSYLVVEWRFELGELRRFIEVTPFVVGSLLLFIDRIEAKIEDSSRNCGLC